MRSDGSARGRDRHPGLPPHGNEFEYGIVPFGDAAARTNRQALRQALVAWETLTGGNLVEWESELVDGIERYGFAPNARPR